MVWNALMYAFLHRRNPFRTGRGCRRGEPDSPPVDTAGGEGFVPAEPPRRMHFRTFRAFFFTAVAAFAAHIAPAQPTLLLRVDDVGMNHAVNMAMREVAEAGLPFSTSVMFACPWHEEAVAILRQHPQASVGVHLTLNSEWKGYRWGPVAGRSRVPSLVDQTGHFHPSVKGFLTSGFDLGEVEIELDAQVERALASGLKIDYVDYHMGTAVSTPALRAIVEKLARKHGLGISMYFNENRRTLFDIPPERKLSELLDVVEKMDPKRPNLVVLHLAKPFPEMQALVDMNTPIMTGAQGESLVATHRVAELAAVLSPEFRAKVGSRVRLGTYRGLIAETGLDRMAAPR